MTTKQTVFLAILGLSGLLSNGQNVQSNALATSGGLQAGTTTSGIGGNTFYGYMAGSITNGGQNNTYIGNKAGAAILNGNENTYIGSNTPPFGGGNKNLAIGYSSGVAAGNANIFIGNRSGAEDGGTGDGNIYIGHNSGFAEGDFGNKLIIDNGFFPQETVAPLIYGDFANDQLRFHAKVGIGGGGGADTPFGNFPTVAGSIDVSKYKLFVKGGVLAEEVRVTLATTWADYVFAKDYKLPTLIEVEKQIQEKGHLANMPSAKEVAANGIELGEMAKLQQEKIEELTLYIIAQNKTNEKQSQEIEALKVLVQTLVAKNK
jgi:hypothetical protein